MSEETNLTLELPNFEGPLDLLLHLIRSQKIDIYDIPIAQITSQYLSYLNKMQKLNLQIAGEYFLMSSTLLRIKSQYLLPKNDFTPEEDEEDPRDELVEQLIQYSVFKKIAHYFKQRNEKVPIVAAKEESIPTEKRVQPLLPGQVTSDELARTFSLLLQKLKMRDPKLLTVKVKETPINEMIEFLANKTRHNKKISFFNCAVKMKNISDIIALFLAALELCKNKQIEIKQSQTFGDLDLRGIG